MVSTTPEKGATVPPSLLSVRKGARSTNPTLAAGAITPLPFLSNKPMICPIAEKKIYAVNQTFINYSTKPCFSSICDTQIMDL